MRLSSIRSSHSCIEETNIDENAVNILRKCRLATMRDFSNVEQEVAPSQSDAR